MNTLTIAAVQMCSTGDRQANLAQAQDLMGRAVSRGAQLIVLPENFSFMGDEGEKLSQVEDLKSGPSVVFLRDFAARYQVAIVGGSVPLAATDGRRVTNSCLVFDASGQIAARYDKIHLFDVAIDNDNTHQESRQVQSGQAAVSVELFERIMGLSICYDLRFPELYRALVRQGAQVLFVPAAFTIPTGRDHWQVLLQARAIENQCYVVAAAQVGQHGGGRATYGRSMVVGPWGQLLAQAQDRPGVIVADLDFDYLEDVRRRLPALRHRRGNLFSLE